MTISENQASYNEKMVQQIKRKLTKNVVNLKLEM